MYYTSPEVAGNRAKFVLGMYSTELPASSKPKHEERHEVVDNPIRLE